MFPLKDSAQVNCLPVITWLLVLINVVCFIRELVLSPDQVESFINLTTIVPATLFSNFGLDQCLKLFSSMFLHVGWGHLIGNMWFLWIFGDGVESRMGHVPYLFLYLGAGIFGALCHAASDIHSMIPVLGASGAISGVLGAYFVLFPRATVSTLILAGFFTRIGELPATFYLGLWFVVQIISALFAGGPSSVDAAQTAFWAHVGGFIAGFWVGRCISGPDQSGDNNAASAC